MKRLNYHLIIIGVVYSIKYNSTEAKLKRDNSHQNHEFTYVAFNGMRHWPQNISERLSYTDKDSVRKQLHMPYTLPFPCDGIPVMRRSLVKPTSVHKLRPGDIDVVAAMGDSLIAGNGAMDDYALGTFIEYRGVSWCAGGDQTWREFLTLPNILKEFNPQIKGYSVGSATFPSPTTALNVAFPISSTNDAIKQAKELVQKMKHDSRINYRNDWKLVTIFFGANDLCSGQCYNKKDTTPLSHSSKLQLALDYLQDFMPRTFVNLIPVIDVSVSVRLKRSLMCRMLHRLFCSCFHQDGDMMSKMIVMARQYQHAERELINSGRYNVKDDFTVVIQPFMTLFNAPFDKYGRSKEVIDISYITHDCFHFSQKGHALAANLLWNNMLEPVGQKSVKRVRYVMEKFYCPLPQVPYFFTYNNSVQFYKTGAQL